MRTFKLSTARGQQIYDMGIRCCWSSLHNLYSSWSGKKQSAFNECWDKYIASENHESFGVGNANSYGFTASWLCTINGQNALRVETKSNSYAVLLDA